jgi:hypothetical protein
MIQAFQGKFYEPYKVITKEITITTSSHKVKLPIEKLCQLIEITCLNSVPTEYFTVVYDKFQSPFGNRIAKIIPIIGKTIPFHNVYLRNYFTIKPGGSTETNLRITYIEFADCEIADIIPEKIDVALWDGDQYQIQGEIYEELDFTTNTIYKIPHSREYAKIKLLGLAFQKKTVYAADFPLITFQITYGSGNLYKQRRFNWDRSCDLTPTEVNISPDDFQKCDLGGGDQGGIYVPAYQVLGETINDYYYQVLNMPLIDASEEIAIRSLTHASVSTYDVIVGISLAYYSKL